MSTVIFNKQQLVSGTHLACAASCSKSDKDIYDFVRFEVIEHQNRLAAKCTGNNGKCEVNNYSTPISGTPLVFCVNGRQFKDLISTYNDKDNIELCVEEDQISIKQGNSKQKLKTKPIDDFPNFKLQEQENSTELSVKTSAFTFALERVLFASTNSTQDYLKAVNLNVQNGILEFTAADGVLLSQFTIPASVSGSLDQNVSLSPEVVSQLLNIKQVNENSKIVLSATKFNLRTGDVLINASVKGSKYPFDNINAIFQNHVVETQLSIDKTDLKRAIDRIRITCEKPSTSVLQFKTNKQRLSISDSHVTTQSVESISVESSNEKPVFVGFSLAYITNALSQIKSAKVNLKIANMNDKTIGVFEDPAHPDQPIILTSCRL